MMDAADDPDVIEDFFGVYLLYCTNPKYLGWNYIGFTVNPNRRVNQHNKGTKSGGAWRTSNKGPWEMVLIIHGFPNEISALRFEWAWQHPSRSRRLCKRVAKKKSREKSYDFQLRVLSEMLRVGPWVRLPLTIRWLKPKFERSFPIHATPPSHMSIVRGPLTIKKLTTDLDSSAFSEVKCGGSCYLCSKEVPNNLSVRCLSEVCPMVAHIFCLATHFLPPLNRTHLIPVSGNCPKCSMACLWGDLVRKKKGCNVGLGSLV